MTIIVLLFSAFVVSFAETTTYTYDELNRLIRVEYGDGHYIEYMYDKAGNRRYLGPEDLTPPVTTATPPGGTYNTPQSVTLTCNDGVGSGCEAIYYTTDGNPPTTSSPTYSSPINISAVGTTTLKYFATDISGNSETVETQTYIIINGYITINANASYTNSIDVTLTLFCSFGNGCSNMKFSNDGTTYSTEEPFATTKAWTLSTGNGRKIVYVKFQDTGGNWSAAYSDTILLDTTSPTTTASPAGGTYNDTQSVALSCSDVGGSGCDKIYYTTDGTTPDTSSAVYSSPIAIPETTTLKYFAVDGAGNNETIKTQTYIIINGSITINSGAAYTNDDNVTLTLTCNTTGGCSNMKFSNNGRPYSTPEAYAPTKAWTLQFFPPGTPAITCTVYVMFQDATSNWSNAYSDTILVDKAAPTTTATPAAGTYLEAQSVTLSCSDPSSPPGVDPHAGSGCDNIYYTTDGTTPTPSSPIYSSPINIAQTTTLKFLAIDRAGNIEDVRTQTYTISTDSIIINYGAESTNSRDVTLALACHIPGGCSKMKFSNNGTTYSTAEAYASTKAWTLSTGNGVKTVYVKFRDTGGNWSAAYSDTILLDTTDPTTTATPLGGTYTGAQSVMLSCNDGSGSGCDKIYYTTNGIPPSTSSPIYSSPIDIVQTTTLKFFATDLAGNSEAVKTQTYIIN
jgi:hypothetical protein